MRSDLAPPDPHYVVLDTVILCGKQGRKWYYNDLEYAKKGGD